MTVKSWRDVIPVFPVADAFPRLYGPNLKDLAEDIQKNGLREPVTLWKAPDGTLYLLDGRSRMDGHELVGMDTNSGGELSVPASHYRKPTIGA